MPARREPSKRRILIVGLVLAAATAGLVGRLAYLQIVRHEVYAAAARDEHFGRDVVYARRGAILDRNGHPLATSVSTFDVYVDRRAWQDGQVAARAADQLAAILGRPAAEIYAAAGSGEGEYLLARNIPYEQGLQIQSAGVRGVRLQPSHLRVYPEGDLATTLLGFLGRDEVGLTGVERDWNDVLMGEPGVILYDRDALGRPIGLSTRRVVPPEPGPDVVLTVDRNIQRMAEERLDRAIRESGATGGDVVVLDPYTGEILAMVSRPAFRFSTLDLNDPNQMDLYRPRAITDVYEPGSIMKLVTMAAGLDTGIITPGTTYEDTGYVSVGGWRIANWDYSVNGVQTMTDVLKKSLNTGSVWVAQALGPERLYHYLSAFGFGQPTGVGLSGEASGWYRQPDDPLWSESDLATNSFGQGMTATPLQVAAAVAAIANGGNLVRPYVVRETVGPDGSRVTRPETVHRVISEATARTLRGMMNQVVDGVPGHLAQVEGYSVAGKSGTTSVLAQDGRYGQSTIASFVAFAPADDPVAVVLVKIDQPKGLYGATVAAPVAADLLRGILTYMKVPPDKPEYVRGGPP
ncbi:MAG TPA: penicillin-binding protein 2 [Dehalococcoidia bacterium]